MPAAQRRVGAVDSMSRYDVDEELLEHVTESKPTDACFVQAMVHFYRGELSRANTWRQRLDATTNWAVAATAALLSIAFSSGSQAHVTVIFAELMVLALLCIEARRYRYYDIWRSRIRILEEDFLAPLLHPPRGGKDAEWADLLSEDLHHPRFKMPYHEAFGRRLQRNYWFLLAILLIGWVVKVGTVPSGAAATDFISRASVGPVPGIAIVLAMAVLHVFLLVTGAATALKRSARGEVLPMEVVGRRWRPEADRDEFDERYSP
ncbi:MAG: DUF2270 domain-containing protein [Armatimonadota bacterium]